MFIRVCALVVITAFLCRPVHAVQLFGPFVAGTASYTLIANGGFESDFTGWTLGAGGGAFSITSVAPLVGLRSAVAIPTSVVTGSGFGMGRTVPVVPGETYVLSAFVDASCSKGGSFYFDLNDVGFEPGGVFGVMGEARLTFTYGQFTVPTGVSAVFVRAIRDGSAGTVAPGLGTFFDDIAITPVAQFRPPMVPEPTGLLGPVSALLLFSGGLAAKKGTRRY